jgi:hypothetical protein
VTMKPMATRQLPGTTQNWKRSELLSPRLGAVVLPTISYSDLTKRINSILFDPHDSRFHLLRHELYEISDDEWCQPRDALYSASAISAPWRSGGKEVAKQKRISISGRPIEQRKA